MGAAASIKPKESKDLDEMRSYLKLPSQRSYRVVSLEDEVVREVAARIAEKKQRSYRVTSLDLEVLGTQFQLEIESDSNSPCSPKVSMSPSQWSTTSDFPDTTCQS